MASSSLGVYKKKNKKRKMKMKETLKNAVNYLKSNTYMFAPLLSKSSDFSPGKSIFTPSRGMEVTKEPCGENNFMKKVVDYLRSDCYMYAPLVDRQTSPLCSKTTKFIPPHTEQARYPKEAAAATAQEKRAEKIKLPPKQAENQKAGAYSCPRSAIHSLAYRETIKHMVQQNCRSSSVSSGSFEEPRKIVGNETHYVKLIHNGS